MLFNSIDYAIFLPIVFALYWIIPPKKIQLQNILLLVSSYFFYACWDYRFLFLLMFSTLLDYVSGLKMGDTSSPGLRKIWFWSSVCINLGFLGIFKYYNFFAASFADLLNSVGFQVNFGLLEIILPVGISFYTFHGLSYVIDIYNGKIEPEKNLIDYSLFVSFFPLLVAGPIERATHLLPQLKKERNFSYSNAVDGLRQILWGLFKKIVIADNCAEIANGIFNNSTDQSGSTLLVGAILFAFQIYGDFSGYSDIALGTARLFGINLLKNFAYPYFSRDIAEFWRRWHISLSSWFKDYLYIPLGGSRGGIIMKLRNTFIIFLVSGFWHGANWTFIFWGFLHAIYYIPLLLSNNNRSNLEIVAKSRILPSFKEVTQIIGTFALVCFAWIFFRANNIQHAFEYIYGIFNRSFFSIPAEFYSREFQVLAGLIFLLILIEWAGREDEYALANLGFNWYKPIRITFYYFLITLIFFFGGNEQQFIYFQF
ncbi:MBOAT family O-acyltransferase [Flavihumibacter cheonanensis]|uniref:MBOAT family O-acyltransferase n=1 Tax=Flavihumibacter cheonanensis TaxID=1442385 RepID=UPI001EF75A36|nr:MBOAT family O-acyltransferase [Flavihumibacter cheonanensis]MCG7753869.1 MBOAT family protein [Flavihumibacter cheonanensis]